MSLLEITTPDGPVNAHLMVPKSAGEGPWPGVVVVHDALGYSADIAQNVARIADAGYVTLAPDLYSRGGVVRCVTRVMREMITGKGRAVADLVATKEALAARPECTGTIGIVGFCMGGGFALLLSTRGYNASAPFYGVLPRHLDEALNNACPIVASFGKLDPSLIGAGKKLEGVLSEKGIDHDIKTYDGASHSFANRLPLGPVAAPLARVTGFGYRAEQTEDAWKRVFGFFATHLTD